MPIGIAVAGDRTCDVVKMNRTGAAMLGIAPEQDVSKSSPDGDLPFRAFRDGRELSREELPMRYAARHGVQVRDFEFGVVRADGSICNLYEYASPLYDEHGAVRGCVGVFVDITERRISEEKLAESQRRLQALFSNATEAFLLCDKDGRYLDVNPSACQVLGYSRDELLGKTIWDLIPAEARSDAHELWRDFHVAGEQSGEIQLLRSDGSRIDLEYRAVANIIPGLHLLILRDLSERKRAENALRESETRFRQLADSMPQMVWSAQPDGFIDYYNRRWYDYTGLPEGQGGDQSWIPVLHPDDVQPCLDRWYHSVRSGESYEIQYRFRDRERGGYRWHLGRALPVRDEQGSIVRWFGTITDIDDQKRAHQALEEASRRKDEFMAMLGHELRNPLVPVRNAAELLRLAADDRATLELAREMIDRQVTHMTRLIDDLLDVSRISSGKILLRKERLDLAALIRRTLEDHRMMLETSGLHLSAELTDEPLWVDGDPTRLYQSVGNLLQNAQKFTDAGGRVAVRLRRSDDAALLTVTDTGIGMDEDMLARVFEPFAQADQSLHRSRGGLGLGLALVRGLVEAHGGSVRARSAGLGHGSELSLRLPLSPAPDRHPGRAAPSPSAGERSLRILVVEDIADTAHSLRMLLELAGHRVEVAGNGTEALLSATRFRPEVVLCDIGLPGGMDGYDLARALREQADGAPPSLIALTGYGQEQDRLRSLRAGFEAHLTKPIDLKELQRLLAEVAQR